jgi:ppGpp synthetase/RelA/SpoT-type nucleotidyltranferase
MVQKYSKAHIDRVGEILISETALTEEKEIAVMTLNNWRMLHSYPLNIFRDELQEHVRQVDPDAIVAQRLKRLPTILHKIKERKTIQRLSQMQDIAGLRVIVDNVDAVYALKERYERQRAWKRVKDYISEPRATGYRGVHLIYEYVNAKNPASDGLLVEIQLRTRLQHLWATAVETIDFLWQDSLKYSTGSYQWTEFFKLVSAAFTCREGTNQLKCFEEISCAEIAKQLQLTLVKQSLGSTLEAIKTLSFVKDNPALTNSKYWVVSSSLKDAVKIYYFNEDQLEQATGFYNDEERKTHKDAKSQVVLISVDSFKKIEEAYPNFFLNIHKFLVELNYVAGL